jgi:hypothetical protein
MVAGVEVLLLRQNVLRRFSDYVLVIELDRWGDLSTVTVRRYQAQ